MSHEEGPRGVEARVLGVLTNLLGLDEGDVTPADRLAADLGLCSVDLIDLLFRLEDEFRISLDLGADVGAADDLTARHVVDAVRASLVRATGG